MKLQTLLLCLLLIFSQESNGQVVVENDDYVYHSFNLLGDIEFVIEEFGEDSMVIRATDQKNFNFHVGFNDNHQRWFTSQVGRMIEVAQSEEIRFNFSFFEDTILIVENFNELPRSRSPLKDQFEEDSIKDGNYVYPSSTHLFEENSFVYDMKNSRFLLQNKHRIYGDRIIASDDIQFCELYEDSTKYVWRKVYTFDFETLQSKEIGAMPYEDMESHHSLVSPVGYPSYSYAPDNIFWDKLNGIDIKKKYHFLYPEEDW